MALLTRELRVPSFPNWLIYGFPRAGFFLSTSLLFTQILHRTRPGPTSCGVMDKDSSHDILADTHYRVSTGDVDIHGQLVETENTTGCQIFL